jgi:hypothetical protein
MQPMVERLVAAGKPSVEPERILLSLIRDFRTAAHPVTEKMESLAKGGNFISNLFN